MVEYINIIMLVAYVALLIFIGVLNAGTVKNIRSYIFGTAKSHTGMVASSLLATSMGAGSLLGITEQVYKHGIVFCSVLIISPIMWIVMSSIFAKRIEEFREAGCISVSDVAEHLYGLPGRIVSSISGIAVSICAVAIQILGVSYLFQIFFNCSSIQGFIYGFGLIVLYSVVGGMKVVLSTHILQVILLAVALPLISFAAFYDLGGWNMILENLPHTHTSMAVTPENTLRFILFGIWAALYSGPSFIQRMLAAQEGSNLKVALRGLAVSYIPIMILLFSIGIIMRAESQDLDSGIVIYTLINNHCPILLKCIVIICFLVSLIAAADSWLDTASIICVRDISRFMPHKVHDVTAVYIARASLVIIAIFGMCIALYTQGIFALSIMCTNFWVGVPYVPIAVGFLGVIAPSWVFVCATCFGLVGLWYGFHLEDLHPFIESSGITTIHGASFSFVGFAIAYALHVKSMGMPILNKCLSHIWLDFYYSYLHRNFSLDALVYALKRHDQASSKWRYYCLGLFGTIYFIFSSITLNYPGDIAKSIIIILRIVGVVACFFLCLHEVYMPQRLQEIIMPYLWHFSIVYCLPFISIYTAIATDYNILWLINVGFSIVMLYILSTPSVTFWGAIAGMVSAKAVSAITDYSVIPGLSNESNLAMKLLLIYALSILLTVYIMHTSRSNQEKDSRSKLLYGRAIAHELLTPLTGANVVAEYLTKSYENSSIDNSEDIVRLQKMLSLLTISCKKGIRSIRMMLTALKDDLSIAHDTSVYSMSQCISETLIEYGFSEYEERKVQVLYYQNKDFEFYGSKHLLKQALNNLIHNAFKHAGYGANIKIWWKSHTLYLMDDGVGIAKHLRPNLFRRFRNSSMSLGNSGVGLVFVKMVMQQFGGDVKCDSIEGEYTLFELSFPTSISEELKSMRPPDTANKDDFVIMH